MSTDRSRFPRAWSNSTRDTKAACFRMSPTVRVEVTTVYVL